MTPGLSPPFSISLGCHLQDWNENCFYDGKQFGGQQSYPLLRNTLHDLVAKAVPLDTHRNHRERAPPSGMVKPVITT